MIFDVEIHLEGDSSTKRHWGVHVDGGPLILNVTNVSGILLGSMTESEIVFENNRIVAKGFVNTSSSGMLPRWSEQTWFITRSCK